MNLDKQGVYDCLRDHHIDFEITDHAPLFSMSGMRRIYLYEIINESITI